MLNNGTSKLDHLITIGKSFDDHSGVGYKDESSGIKTAFVKSRLLDDSVNGSYNKPVMKSVATESKSTVKQSVATGKSVKNSGQKRKGKVFVPIFHFCGAKGHTRPRCFTLMNFLENHYEKSNLTRYSQKTTPKPKIDWGNDSRKIWVKKSELKCFVSFTCLRIGASNSWYFGSGCSRHMIGDKDILVDYNPLSEGLVTFSDGVTTRVLGKGTCWLFSFQS